MPGEQRSAVGLPIGWLPGDEGSYVLNEPDGARTWMPVNDHPSDKADWRFEITVPPDRIAVANGELEPRSAGGEAGADDSWTWVQDEPMSTYLVQVIVGDYDVIDGGSVPSITWPSDPADACRARRSAVCVRGGDRRDRRPNRVLRGSLRPVPARPLRIGVRRRAPRTSRWRHRAARCSAPPISTPRRLGDFQELLLSHELAHQWFGNAVSPATWNDIWLNESLTSYAQWLWLDHIGLQPLDGYADAVLSRRQTGGGATGEPTLDDMFGFTRYDGGAAVVHALRAVMGDDAFFELMTRWVGDHVGTAQSTDTFVALAGEIHGADLGPFFDEWLYADTLPDSYP